MKLDLNSLLIIGLLSVSANAALIPGTTIQSATIGLNGAMGPENAINGKGLPGEVPALSGSHRQAHDTNWWTGWSAGVTDWQITVDLEGIYALDVIHVWNYREGGALNGRGLRNVEIYVSPDEDEANLVKLVTDGTGLHDNGSGDFLFPIAPTDPDYLGFDLDTSGVTNAALLDNVRLVRIDGGSDNHNGGSDHGGLAEIQFGGSGTAAPPGPVLIAGTTIESATIGLNGAMGPENAISGKGLPGEVPALSGSHRQAHDTNWWTGWSAGVTDWQITVDLEGVYTLDVIHIWNYREGGALNGRGLRNVEIFVAPDENEANLVKLVTDGTGLHDNGSGGFLFPIAPTDPEYLGFDLDTSGVTNAGLLDDVRLVRIDGGSDNHNGGSDHGGLAEIQFGTIPVPEGPEASQLIITPTQASPGNYDFSWESQDSKIYDLVSSTELSTAPDTWPVWNGNSNIASGGTSTSLTGVPGGGDPNRFFAVIEKDPEPVEIFAENFDGATPGSLPTDWTSGTNPADNSSLTSWELGTPANLGPVPPGVPLPSGANCVATNISGIYDDPVSDLGVAHTDIWLRTPAIDLGAASEGTLTFQQWTQIEDVPGDLDYGSIRILDASDNSELAVMEDQSIDGNTSGWEEYSMALPAAAFTATAGTIKVEFRFEADDIDSFAGWYIDDVLLTVPGP